MSLYEQLLKPDQIRLLKIEPPRSKAETAIDEPLVCSLSTWQLRRAPAYSTISYEWKTSSENGDPCVSVNGTQIEIRNNLFDCLRRLRTIKRLGYVWIDALCINQNDNREKNVQIPLMHDIYLRASAVIVWLGESHEKLSTAMRLLNSGRAVSHRNPSFAKSILHVLQPMITDCTYWCRTWIVQEILISRKIEIHCGPDRVPWPSLERHFLHLRKCLKPNDQKPLNRAGACILWKSRRARQRFSAHDISEHEPAAILRGLIDTYKHTKCSDPRDKVYSLLALAGHRLEAPKDRLLVDYSRSVADVFTDVLRYISRADANAAADMVRFGRVLATALGMNCDTGAALCSQPQASLTVICTGYAVCRLYYTQKGGRWCVREYCPGQQALGDDHHCEALLCMRPSRQVEYWFCPTETKVEDYTLPELVWTKPSKTGYPQNLTGSIVCLFDGIVDHAVILGPLTTSWTVVGKAKLTPPDYEYLNAKLTPASITVDLDMKSLLQLSAHT
ncbi:hypothetical protein H2203_004460 [Taxawa tesnikishii (nom. ined.)]|nr:hypothetical protein H2203_004460 [Dothideales sp. JES 119]